MVSVDGYGYTTLSSTLATTTVAGQKTQLYQAISTVVPKGDSSDVNTPSVGPYLAQLDLLLIWDRLMLVAIRALVIRVCGPTIP